MKIKFLCVGFFIVLSSCGSKNQSDHGLSVKDQSNIISGQEVSSFDPIAKNSVFIYFYQKAELEDEKPAKLGKCSGVIVGKKSILTAAHCFEPPKNNLKNFIEVYFARSGENIDQLEKDDRMIGAINFKYHPYYDPKFSLHFDLAMITLSKEIPADYEPIAILPFDIQLKIGDTVVPAGYGKRTEVDGDSNQRLNKSSGLKVVEDWGTHFYIDQANGNGICSGDSGGPTFIQSKGKWFLVGINHGTTAPASQGKITCRDKGAIIKLQTHINWIQKNIVN